MDIGSILVCCTLDTNRDILVRIKEKSGYTDKDYMERAMVGFNHAMEGYRCVSMEKAETDLTGWKTFTCTYVRKDELC